MKNNTKILQRPHGLRGTPAIRRFLFAGSAP